MLIFKQLFTSFKVCSSIA